MLQNSHTRLLKNRLLLYRFQNKRFSFFETPHLFLQVVTNLFFHPLQETSPISQSHCDRLPPVVALVRSALCARKRALQKENFIQLLEQLTVGCNPRRKLFKRRECEKWRILFHAVLLHLSPNSSWDVGPLLAHGRELKMRNENFKWFNWCHRISYYIIISALYLVLYRDRILFLVQFHSLDVR